jgi:plasmid stabilization system protein ParE
MARYRLLREARQELEAAMSFYDAEHAGLGRDFAIEVRRLCERIAESPFAGAELRGAVRRRLVRRFPYAVLYVIDDEQVMVIAVAHQRRRPGYWVK